MSILAKVIRQFHNDGECVELHRVLTRPCQPTMGTRLDLHAHGVAAPLEVVAVTVRAHRRPPMSEPTPSPTERPERRTFASTKVLPVLRHGRAPEPANRLLQQVPGDADPATPDRAEPRGARAAHSGAGEVRNVTLSGGGHHADRCRLFATRLNLLRQGERVPFTARSRLHRPGHLRRPGRDRGAVTARVHDHAGDHDQWRGCRRLRPEAARGAFGVALIAWTGSRWALVDNDVFSVREQ